MASARESAQASLGDIRDYVNYEGYQKIRDLAQNNYNNSIKSLQDKYNALSDTINKNRQQLYKDLTSGRATVANDYYAKNNLTNGTKLSSYLGNTGVGGLNKISNRMNLGNENSKLANTYYKGTDELDTQLKAATNERNLNMETARNTLDNILSDTNMREKEAENDYNQKLAALAEQIQQRMDSNANAQAALAEQRRYNNETLKNQLKTMTQQFNARLNDLAGDTPTYESYLNAIRYWLNVGATDPNNRNVEAARKYLNNIGIYAPTDFDAKYTIPSLEDILAGKYVNTSPVSKAPTRTQKKTKKPTAGSPSGINMSWADRFGNLGR